jgi:tetratricopeptide (TPR) repeat protein
LKNLTIIVIFILLSPGKAYAARTTEKHLLGLFAEIEDVMVSQEELPMDKVDSVFALADSFILINKSPLFQARYNYIKGYVFFDRGDLRNAIHPAMSALEFFSAKGDSWEKGKSYLLAGYIYESGGLFYEAHQYYLQSYELLQDFRDNFTGFAALGLARTSTRIGNDHKEFLEIAREIMFKLKDKKYQVLYLMQLPSFESSHRKCIIIYQQALELYKDVNNDKVLFQIWTGLANKYYHLKKFDTVQIYLSVLDSIKMESKISPSLELNYLILAAAVDLSWRRYKRAENKYIRILKISQENDYRMALNIAYKGMYELLKHNKNYEEALVYLQKQSDLKDVIVEERKQITTLLLDAQFQSLQRIKELRSLQVRIVWIVIFGVIAFLLLLGWLLILQHQREKVSKKQQTELRRLFAKIHKEQVIVESLQSQVTRMVKKEEGKSRDHLMNISDRLHGVALSEADQLELFRIIDMFFEGAYAEMMRDCKQLTVSDCRYLVFFAMEFTPHTVAAFNNVQISSLRKTRQRLREKLGLKTPTQLDEFITSLVEMDKIPRMDEFKDQLTAIFAPPAEAAKPV